MPASVAMPIFLELSIRSEMCLQTTLGDFMPDDAGQFFFGFENGKQAAVEEYVAGWGGKGVKRIFMEYMELIVEGLGRDHGQNSFAHPVDIIDDDRVL